MMKKFQNLPLRTRKVILWSVIIVLAFGLLVWWAKNIQRRLESFRGEEFIKGLNFPKLYGEEATTTE